MATQHQDHSTCWILWPKTRQPLQLQQWQELLQEALWPVPLVLLQVKLLGICQHIMRTILDDQNKKITMSMLYGSPLYLSRSMLAASQSFSLIFILNILKHAGAKTGALMVAVGAAAAGQSPPPPPPTRPRLL